MFVTYSGPTMNVALHRDLSLSHSRSVTRKVKYCGEGFCDERDYVSLYTEHSVIQLVLSKIWDERNYVSFCKIAKTSPTTNGSTLYATIGLAR